MATQKSVSFLLVEVITCGAVLSTFELVQALKRLGIDARIVSDYNNKELENYFGVTIEREPKGITIAVSPKCDGDWAYVRTRDDRWKTHKSKKIVVSKYLQDWLRDGIIIGNGTHKRFRDLGLERDIDVLICGNYEWNKAIDETLDRAKSHGEKIVWFGRQTVPKTGVETISSPSIDEIVRLYNRTKCFISASKNEGWGRPIAEAMACGVPKIINENGGNREIEVVPWSNIANQFIKTLWPSQK